MRRCSGELETKGLLLIYCGLVNNLLMIDLSSVVITEGLRQTGSRYLTGRLWGGGRVGVVGVDGWCYVIMVNGW